MTTKEIREKEARVKDAADSVGQIISYIADLGNSQKANDAFNKPADIRASDMDDFLIELNNRASNAIDEGLLTASDLINVVGSNYAGMGYGGFVALMHTLSGNLGEGIKRMGDIQKALGLMPKRESTGKALQGLLDSPVGQFGQWIDDEGIKIGDKTMDATNNPELAAVGRIAPDLILEVLPLAIALKSVKNTSRAGKYTPKIFIGANAKLDDTQKSLLRLAKKMKTDGATEKQIWKKTGWFQGGKDKKWRFEIKDDVFKLRNNNTKFSDEWYDVQDYTMEKVAQREFGKSADEITDVSDRNFLTEQATDFPDYEGYYRDQEIKYYADDIELKEFKNKDGSYKSFDQLSDQQKRMVQENVDNYVVNFEGQLYEIIDHPEFQKAYPDLYYELKANIKRGSGGDYDGWNDTINARGSNRMEQESTMLHEIQHAIQDKEGFASGSSPSNFEKLSYTDELLGETNSAIELGKALKKKGYELSDIKSRTVDATDDSYVVFTMKDGKKIYSDDLDVSAVDIKKANYMGSDTLETLKDRAAELELQTNNRELQLIRYRKTTGEVEARNVEGRRFPEEASLTTKRGRAIEDSDDAYRQFPKDTESYPTDEQIFLDTDGNYRRNASPESVPELDMSEAARNRRSIEQGYDIDAYHATTHSIDEFGGGNYNKENYFGGGDYFTDNADDAAKNYLADGADVTDRIQQRAEYLELHEDLDEAVALERARKDILGDNEGVIYPVKIQSGKKYIVDGKDDTFLAYEPDPPDWRQFLDDADGDEDLARDIAMEVAYDNEPVGELVDFIAAFKKNARDMDIPEEDYSYLLEKIQNEGMDFGGIKSSDLDNIVRDSTTYFEGYDEKTGMPVMLESELYRRTLKDIGYDTIIHNASKDFPNLTVGDNTRHIIPLNVEKGQVRSRYAKFDPENIGKNNLSGHIDPELVGVMGAGAAAYLTGRRGRRAVQKGKNALAETTSQVRSEEERKKKNALK